MQLNSQTQAFKLHKPLLNGIGASLTSIFNDKRYSDKVLEKLFKQNKQWGSRDRKFVAESVYDIVRYYRLLSEIAQTKNNYFFITAVYLVLKGVELPSWPEFKHINKNVILDAYSSLKNQFEYMQSYPDVMNEICEAELGKEKWQAEATAMNAMAEVVIRSNELKTTTKDLQEKLLAEGIETEEIANASNALRLKKRSNIFSSRYFKEGYFEIQDAGSQEIGLYTEAKPKQFIIDACAGAGGKSLQLAGMMTNKGKVIAMDVAQWKLDELSKRAKRASATNIETRLIDGTKSIKAFEEKADVLLLDVPCTGIGVLKRNPDAKWKFNMESFNKTKALQAEILNDYSKMVKPGGVMVYSTCSILPSENREQVDAFLRNNPNFTFNNDRTIFPSEGFDGFYMCKLNKL